MIWHLLCKGGIVNNEMDGGPRSNAPNPRSRPPSVSSKCNTERSPSEPRTRTSSVSSKRGEKTPPPPKRRNTITASEFLRRPKGRGSRKNKTSVLVERITEYCNVYTEPMIGQLIQEVKVPAISVLITKYDFFIVVWIYCIVSLYCIVFDLNCFFRG